MKTDVPIIDFMALPFRAAAHTIRDVTHTRVNDPRTTHRVWVVIRVNSGVMDAVRFLVEGESSWDDDVWWAIAS